MDEQNTNTLEMISAEVLSLFTSDAFFNGLFFGKADIDAIQFDVTMNIFRADDLWGEQCHDPPYNTWSDVFENAQGEEEARVIRSVGYDNFRDVGERLWDVSYSVRDFMNSRLSETDDQRHPDIAAILHWFIEDVSDHARSTARAEYYKKKGFEFPFQDLILDALKQGGFPVNWKGTYPKGQLVVFHW